MPPIICNSCGHSNNPLREKCFKCGADITDLRSGFTLIPVNRPPGWFDFIFTTNVILSILAWFVLIILFIAGIHTISIPFPFAIFIIWVVLFTHASIRLGMYQNGARHYYLLILGFSAFFSGLTGSTIEFILCLFLIYGIGLREENIKYYDTMVKNKQFSY